MGLSMTRVRRTGLFLMLLSAGISILWGISLVRGVSYGMVDFRAVYYGARCLIQHGDPYQQDEFLRVYQAEGGAFPSDPVQARLFRRAVPICINLPASLFLVTPLAFLPWGPAQVLWMIFLSASIILAAFLMWDLAGNDAPAVALFLICILLANSELLFALGNTAGIAVSLCMIAVWCFLKERFLLAGVLCLALSLAIKPHDAGLVWLFFLLAGGVHRKRALQTLAVTVVLSLAAILWVSHAAPHWMPELRANLSETLAHGDLNDPGPASIAFGHANMVIDLQSAISIFRDDPRIYNPASYLVCGALLLVWSVRTLRSRFSLARAWLALGAVVPLAMLATYHRSYDAKLLLLTVPACAMLWAGGGAIGWIALTANTAGMVLTGDIPSVILGIVARSMHLVPVGIFGKLMTVLLMRPASLVLLGMSIFYLWAYMRRDPDELRQ
jgi:hypothetical protein